MSSEDPDSCIPEVIKNVIFDLHDSVATSQIYDEQVTLYNVTFRDLSQKYFASSPWPSPRSIASECGGDPLFLALYRELTHRHLHSVTRPSARDRIEGWHVYRELFDELLHPDAQSFYIFPEWAFEILNEFVYQFQGYCQLRSSLAAKKAQQETAKHHVSENIQIIQEHPDVWSVEVVLSYLHSLIKMGLSPNAAPAFLHLAFFASVTLSRLECLLCDYNASLRALTPVYTRTDIVIALADDNKKSPLELVNSVFSARLSMVYHMGVSYFMLRRYKDAIRVLGELCSFMQRGFKTGQLRKLHGGELFNKQYDRMLALLAILTHICPNTSSLEDNVAKVLRDKYVSQLNKIDAGEEGYEDLFVFGCPKFVSPAMPDFTTGGQHHDAYKSQVKQFMNEMAPQQELRKLRSYMKLYTSINVSKLASFNDKDEEEFCAVLNSLKHRMHQVENGGVAGSAPIDGTVQSAMDIHYYVVDTMIHVDEAEKQRRFENYFMSQISQYQDVIRDVENINIKL